MRIKAWPSGIPSVKEQEQRKSLQKALRKGQRCRRKAMRRTGLGATGRRLRFRSGHQCHESLRGHARNKKDHWV